MATAERWARGDTEHPSLKEQGMSCLGTSQEACKEVRETGTHSATESRSRPGNAGISRFHHEGVFPPSPLASPTRTVQRGGRQSRFLARLV